MPAFLVTVWATILRLCGLSALAPAFARPPTNHPQNRAAPPKPAPRGRQLRLSRVTGPRRALRVIADSVGQISGFPRDPHDPRDLEVAWMQLGDPVAGFVKAQIALSESVPMFLEADDENARLDELALKAQRSPMTYIRAIWREAPIRASLQATTFLAHRVQRQFRGSVPKPERTNGAAGEREWHVVDSMDRPVICRLLERDDGRLEILDGRGGFLHRDTLALSCWRLVEGWLPAGSFPIRGRNDGDGDGSPNPKPQPGLIKPKI